MTNFNTDDSQGLPRRGWSERVRYSRRAGGYAYRPGHVLCAGDTARDGVLELRPDAKLDRLALGDGDHLYRVVVDEDDDIEDLIAGLRDRNVAAEANYVLFAHPMYANPMYANPMYANPMYANPMYANPMYANPMYANPMYANPMYANPMYANPVYASPVYASPVVSGGPLDDDYVCSGLRPSTARPASAPAQAPSAYSPKKAVTPRVVILDTGISAPTCCPAVLAALAAKFPGAWEVPDTQYPNNPVDGFLDPSSGHGTFIAGLIHMLAPGQMIVPARVVESFGDVDVWTVAAALEKLRRRKVLDDRTIVNMSFGGYADDHMSVLAAAVRRVRRTGAVVVASAGNDATDRPMFPACLPDVVAVGALDPYGPAAYTNFGAWVDACAPGSDLVSTFFEFDGKMEVWPKPGSVDPDEFEQWARWSGTSFAAPIVAAALVRQMVLAGGTARDAVEQVITAGGLFRLPGLGTVVNHTPLDPGCLAKW